MDTQKEMSNIKAKIRYRQMANKELLDILGELMVKNPQQRFGQILVNYGFIDQQVAIGGGMKTIDPFNEEPVDMLDRVEKTIERINSQNNA